jgi:5-methyltetrahydropteroyltriglutamate--homocysteine methyltransferase
MLFPTTIVGSFPQPEWLIDRAKLAGRFPPRVRAQELWRIPPQYLAEAQDDATLIAIRAQEEAGLDIVSDGEIRRESYSNRFATALEGVDLDNPGTALDRSGHPNPVPRIVGKIRRMRPVEVDDLKFLRAHTDRQVKITVPGPVHHAAAGAERLLRERGRGGDGLRRGGQRGDQGPVRRRRRRRADRRALHAGAAEKARLYGLAALNRALEGVQGTTAVHICFGYAAIIHERPSGYSFLPELAPVQLPQVSIETAQSHLDCSALQAARGQEADGRLHRPLRPAVETPETVVARIERALPYVKAENVILAPDCGMKYLPRETASAKLGRWSPRRRSCAQGTAELAGKGNPMLFAFVLRDAPAWRRDASRSGPSTRRTSAPSPTGLPSPGRCSTDAGAMSGSLLVIDFADRAARCAGSPRAVHRAGVYGASEVTAFRNLWPQKAGFRRNLRPPRCASSLSRCACRVSSSARARCDRCGTRSS